MNLSQYCNELDMNFDFLMVDTAHALNFRDHRTIQSRDIALTRSGKCKIVNLRFVINTLFFCFCLDTSIKYSWW